MADADRLMRRIATEQFGLVNRTQLGACGLTRHMIRTRLRRGDLEIFHEGVYRVAGAPASWNQRCMGALLHRPERVALSHRCAAAHLRLDGVPRGKVEIVVPGHGNNFAPGVIVHSTGRWSRSDKMRFGPFTMTDVCRTLLDLGAVCRLGVVEFALASALREGMTTIIELRNRLAALGGRGRAGTATIRALLAERDPDDAVVQSALERLTLLLLNDPRLPRPMLQYEVQVNGGRRFLDFAYPDLLVGVEADSLRHHAGLRALREDRRRLNELGELGWRIVHVTHFDLTHQPEGIVRTLLAYIDLAKRSLAPNFSQ